MSVKLINLCYDLCLYCTLSYYILTQISSWPFFNEVLIALSHAMLWCTFSISWSVLSAAILCKWSCRHPQCLINLLSCSISFFSILTILCIVNSACCLIADSLPTGKSYAAGGFRTWEEKGLFLLKQVTCVGIIFFHRCLQTQLLMEENA